jgi:hypothetical protein
VVAGVNKPAGRMVVIVLVKAVPPFIVVNEVDRGVGTTTSTKVVVVAPTPSKPPFVWKTVVVKPIVPLVLVVVVKALQKGNALFKHAVRLEVIVVSATPFAKQRAAAVFPKVPRVVWQTAAREPLVGEHTLGREDTHRVHNGRLLFRHPKKSAPVNRLSKEPVKHTAASVVPYTPSAV